MKLPDFTNVSLESLETYQKLAATIIRKVLMSYCIHDYEELESFVVYKLITGDANWENGPKKMEKESYRNLVGKFAIFSWLRSLKTKKQDCFSYSNNVNDIFCLDKELEEESKILNLLNKLTPLQRKTVEAHYIDGQTLQSIADESGVTKAAIQNRAEEGLKKLRKLL